MHWIALKTRASLLPSLPSFSIFLKTQRTRSLIREGVVVGQIQDRKFFASVLAIPVGHSRSEKSARLEQRLLEKYMTLQRQVESVFAYLNRTSPKALIRDEGISASGICSVKIEWEQPNNQLIFEAGQVGINVLFTANNCFLTAFVIGRLIFALEIALPLIQTYHTQ
jgi:hypothetical protein